MPIMRHWANNGGVVGDYGGLPSSVLVIRAMSAVYNYDYIQVREVVVSHEPFCLKRGYCKNWEHLLIQKQGRRLWVVTWALLR